MNIHRIKQLHRIIERALFNNDTTLDYTSTLKAIAMLADGVRDYSGSSEDIWYMETLHYCYIGDILVGAYWHSVDWQSADQTDLMKMQASVGNVYTPSMADSGPEPETYEYDVYEGLETLRQ